MRRLPPTDIANYAVQGRAQRRLSLRHHKSGFPSFTYRPIRSIIPDVINVQFFGKTGERIAYGRSETIVLSKCNKGKNFELEKKHNLQVLKALYRFCETNNCTGVTEHFGSFLFDINGGAEYWYDAVINVDGEPYVLFFDTRKSSSLSANARKFIFSIMHEHIRVRIPDLADVKLGILQFRGGQRDARKTRLITASDDLFSFNELEGMLIALYEDWKEISDDRVYESQRANDDWDEDRDDGQFNIFTRR